MCGPASGLRCRPQTTAIRETQPSTRGPHIPRTHGPLPGPGGHDGVPLLSSWLSPKQGAPGRRQPPHERRRSGLCVCLSQSPPPCPAAEPSDNLIMPIPLPGRARQTHISSSPLESGWARQNDVLLLRTGQPGGLAQGGEEGNRKSFDEGSQARNRGGGPVRTPPQEHGPGPSLGGQGRTLHGASVTAPGPRSLGEPGAPRSPGFTTPGRTPVHQCL